MAQNNWNWFYHCSGGQKSVVKVQTGCLLVEAYWGNHSSPSPGISNSWCSLAFPDLGPCQLLSKPSHAILLSLIYRDTCHWILDLHSLSMVSRSSTWLHVQSPFFPNKVTFSKFWGLRRQAYIWGLQFNPSIQKINEWIIPTLLITYQKDNKPRARLKKSLNDFIGWLKNPALTQMLCNSKLFFFF